MCIHGTSPTSCHPILCIVHTPLTSCHLIHLSSWLPTCCYSATLDQSSYLLSTAGSTEDYKDRLSRSVLGELLCQGAFEAPLVVLSTTYMCHFVYCPVSRSHPRVCAITESFSFSLLWLTANLTPPPPPLSHTSSLGNIPAISFFYSLLCQHTSPLFLSLTLSHPHNMSVS